MTFSLAPMSDNGFANLVTGLLRGAADDASSEATVPREYPPEPVDSVVRQREPRPVGPEAPARETVPEPRETDVPPAVDDLRPRRLEITDDELRFLATLAPMVPSPRAAKRLVNLYRLFRARLTARELDDFLAMPESGYRAVLVLLALTVGPRDPSDFFRQIDDYPRNETVEHWPWNVVAGTPLRTASYRRWLPLIRRCSFPSS